MKNKTANSGATKKTKILLVAKINRRNKVGTNRNKADSTISAEAYSEMKKAGGKRAESETKVPTQLQNLCGEPACRKEHRSNESEQAVHLQHRAVHIHAIVNGNGRYPRRLASIWLNLKKSPAIEWPEDSIRTLSIIHNVY